MEIVEWSDAYSVGNVLMDAHHRVFFQMVKEFSEAPDQDMRATMQQQIAFLAEYVIMHLAAEESLMREAGYPDIDKHKALHDAFAHKVHAARDAFPTDQGSVSAEVILQTMQDWFLNHIRDEDRKYAPYLRHRP
ncbi:MAG: hemerythrin family protein [Sulfuritalea sp.]|nr:hemerythrin family protein [Sulfuritalea sp.]